MNKFITDFTGLKYNRFGWPILPKGTKVWMKDENNMKSIFASRSVTPGMTKLAGKIKEILDYKENEDNFYYRLKGELYFFDSGMFEVIELPENIIDTDKKTIHIAKYQQGYVTIVEGYFDDRNIFFDIDEIIKEYKNCNIINLF